MKLGIATPILRIFDVAKAYEFYVGFLGFKVQWEHRFEEGLPLYAQVAREGCMLHLSEHHGDGTPGSTLRVAVEDIAEFHRQLLAKDYRFARPAMCESSWGTTEVSIADPFGNTLRFFEQLPNDEQPAKS